MNILTDLLNIREVMTGDISTREHTFFYTVCKQIADANNMSMNNLRGQIEEVTRLRSILSHTRRAVIERICTKIRRRLERRRRRRVAPMEVRRPVGRPRAVARPIEPIAEPRLNEAFHEDNPRSRRRTRPPNRLNIASTRGRSYEN